MGFKSSMFPKSSIKFGGRLISNVITTTVLLPTLLWSRSNRVSDEDFVVLCVIVISLIIYTLCSAYEFVIWILLSLICISFAVFAIRRHQTNKKLTADAERVRNAKPILPITPLFSYMLRSNQQLEIYFHFIYRPLMTKEEFNHIHWGDKCNKCYYKQYKQYKKDWHEIYWHHSLQHKAHHLLTQLLNEEYIPERGFQQVIKRRLYENLCFGEKRIIKVYNYSFRRKSDKHLINHSQYCKLWNDNKIMKVSDYLHQDFLDRMKKVTCECSWGTIWNREVLGIIDRYYSGDAIVFSQMNNIELVLIDTSKSECECQSSHTGACPYTFLQKKQRFVIAQNDIRNICDVAWKILAPHIKEYHLLHCNANDAEPTIIDVECHHKIMHFAIQRTE